MSINTTSYAITMCVLIGNLWAFALDFSMIYGLIGGTICGIVLGKILSVFQNGGSDNVSGEKKESVLLTGSIIGLLIPFGIGAAVLFWLVRFLFVS